MSRMKHTLVTVLIAIFINNIAIGLDWTDDAAAIVISGGEDHTLVLTKNKSVWASGPNGDPIYHSYYGVLGTGSSDTTLVQRSLVRVWDGDMNTPSEYLEHINDVDAGWKHSLALESYDPSYPNYTGYVWAWGNNYWGQLGVGEGTGARSTPIQVLRGAQAPADPINPDPNLSRIVDISAGRSGEHSLAVDANGYAYAWGCNHEGQCGNGISGENQKELVPVYVRRGQQPFDPNRPSVYLNRIIAASAGEWHSMALEQYDPCDPNMDGRVYTWGNNGRRAARAPRKRIA